MSISTIIDKVVISGKITLLTGMHIGASNDFAPIGAVDSVVVRDPLTKKPIIPGSSIKGKLRSLLVKTNAYNENITLLEKGVKYSTPNKDSDLIKGLFGASDPVITARLQFSDLFLTEASVTNFKDKTDLYLTEIKFENTINRLDAVANPRQLERVPAGSEFAFKLVYNIEKEEEIKTDMDALVKALKLVQLDYIGGSGTRGYGKISISELNVKFAKINPHSITKKDFDVLKEAEKYADVLI